MQVISIVRRQVASDTEVAEFSANPRRRGTELMAGSVILPLPFGGTGRRPAGGAPTVAAAQLGIGRVAPDAAVSGRLEREFTKLGKYIP